MPVDPFGQENQIIKDVGLETIHSIPREKAPNPSPSPAGTIHTTWVLAGNWALIQPICSTSLWLLFLSFALEKKKLEKYKQRRGGEGEEDQLQQARQCGAVALGVEQDSQASHTPSRPSLMGEATRRADPVCWVGTRRVLHQK